MEENNFWYGVIACALFVYFLGPAKEIETITIRLAACSDTDYSIFDCPKTISPFTMTYKVLVREQEVVLKGQFGPNGDKCVVYDAENWSCEGKFNFRKMEDGVLWEKHGLMVTKGLYAPKDGGAPYASSYSQIGFFRYWYYKLTMFL